MSAAARKSPERDLVAEAARRALEDAKGDVKTAVSMLETAVRCSRGLRDALTEPLLSSACYDAVRKQVHVDRRRSWSKPVERIVPSRSGVTGSHRVVQLAAGTLLMFPLPGGKKLGEATREEIAAAADFYEAQANDMMVKARWLRLIAQTLPQTTTVSDVLTEDRLRELQEEARRG